MSKFNFDRVLSNMQAVKRDLPVKLANQAQNYFLASFKQQGWDGAHWQEVNRRTEGTKEYKYPARPKASSRTNPIMVRSGKLRRAVSNCIRQATFDKIRCVVDLPYAKRHNDGLDSMPQRHFMGDSPLLRKTQREKISSTIRTIWQK